MPDIIIAFPKIEDGKNIKNILIKNGYEINAVCTNGTQAAGIANELDGGIVLCGYRLTDMHYYELSDYLPERFEMLLIASPKKLEDCVNNNIVCLSLPLRTNDLLDTLQMMMYHDIQKRKKEKGKPKERKEEDKKRIQRAKFILMERNNMSEEEAYRYMQKTSMDSGTKLLETANMILNMREC